MNGPERNRIGIAAFLFVALGAYVALNFQITTDIAHFLPDVDNNEVAALSRDIADSELSRTMIFAIEAADTEAAVNASRAFEEALRRDARVADAITFLEGGPNGDLERSVFELYESRRLAFIAPDVEAAKESLSDDGLRRAAQRLRDELAGPMSVLTSRLAPRDPLMIIPELFRKLERSRANDLEVVDSRFISGDGRTAILFMGTEASAMDSRAQTPLLQAVSGAFAEVSSNSAQPLRLHQSGLNRFATWAAQAIEGDIKRVSFFSVALLCFLLLLLFRSLGFIALASIPVSFGVLAGCAAVLAVFGRLHGITLAFGASLIGVSIDYVVHLYCHHAIVAPEGGAAASLRAIRRPLATGAVTTTAGFAALSASSLVGLREVACFAVVGILAAFLATTLLVPSLISRAARPVAARGRFADRVERGYLKIAQSRSALLLVPVLAIALIAVVLPGARWNSDLASLNYMDPALLAEDDYVRSKVTRFEQMQFVVATGADEELALLANDQVAAHLRLAIESGELAAQQTLSVLLPSASTQRRVAMSAVEDASLPDRLRRVFGESGFQEGAFEPFYQSLADSLADPLTFDDLQASPLGSLVRTFRVELADGVGFITYLNGVEDGAAIEARIASVPGALFLRQKDMFNQAQLEYQQSTLRLLGWGLVAVLVLLAIRYRDVVRTVVAFVPSVIAAGVTVSVMTLMGRGLDLISLTALLFVVSMGVDYSVFLLDARDEKASKSLVAALTGTLLACISTVGAFTLLAVSDHPVLSNLGLTAAVGVAVSLLLAPTMLVFVRREQGAGEEL